jgi:hypothetical protein
MTADASGQLHVFWGEITGSTERDEEATEIYYRRWDGASWQHPVNVFVSEVGGGVRVLAADVDCQGRLHVIWFGEKRFNRVLYHSWAWVQASIDARSFTTRQIITGTGMSDGDLVIDGDGNLHLVFMAENTRSIFYITAHANDDPILWSPAIDVTLKGSTRIVSEPQIALTRDGTRHVVWTEFNQKGFGLGVHYVRSRDGLEWEVPQLIFRPEADERGGILARWITVATDANDNIHLAWSRGVGRVDGRYHQWSEDQGESWSEPRVIQEGYSGSTGYATMVTDNTGQLHMVMSAHNRAVSHETTLFYTIWDRQAKVWTYPESMVSEGFGGERPMLAITGGNTLHVIWHRWSKPVAVLYTQRVLDVPSLPTSSYPAPPSPTPIQPRATTVSTSVSPTATPMETGSCQSSTVHCR